MGALTIRPGRNVWLFARTDRDGPSADTAAQTGAAFANRVLTGETLLPISSPGGPPGGVQRYYLGHARPLDVVALQERPPLPAPPPETTTALALSWRWRHEEQPRPFAIKADVPWYVVVDFDWRGPVTEIDPWPTRAVGPLGIPVERDTELDWLLLEARFLGPATRPDGTWTGDVLKQAKSTAESAAGWGTMLAVLALAYVMGGFDRRGR